MNQPVNDESVRGILGGVMDPELHASITELGMVGNITIDGSSVGVEIALTTLGCPLRAEIKKEVESKVSSLPGVETVKVEYKEMNQEQKSRAMERARLVARDNAPDTEIPATTRVLAIASGKGGVGKSSVTVNLAAALAEEGFIVGVLDADIRGFSVPRMLGVEGRLEGNEGLIDPAQLKVGKGTLKVVSMGLLVEKEETALMWRGLMLAKAVEEFLVKVRWGELDYLLIDMPPGTGDIQMALARLLPQAEMLVVTTPALAAQKVASRVADMARRSHMKILGVVENMSAFVSPDGTEHAIFGSGGGETLALDIDAPLVGTIPMDETVSAGGDAGQPVVQAHAETQSAKAFKALAEKVSSELLPPVDMAGCSARILHIFDEL